jgi:hypothetical protein
MTVLDLVYHNRIPSPRTDAGWLKGPAESSWWPILKALRTRGRRPAVRRECLDEPLSKIEETPVVTAAVPELETDRRPDSGVYRPG